MRSTWSGSITLSLLNMPVKLGSTTKDNSLGLHMVRATDGSKIRFTRVAEADGKEVPWGATAKGYDAPDGSLVILDNKDFEAAYGSKNRVANVLMFTDASNIPPMAAKTSYWVQPDIGGEKTYALLAQALQATGKVAVLTFAMRERVSVAVLRPHDGYLSLESLQWDSDLIKPDFAAPPQTATEAEQELALKLIEQMTAKYDHATQVDESAEALRAVIQHKIEAGHVLKPATSDAPKQGMPQDLAASLQAAVDAQKGKTQPKRVTRSKAA